MVDILDHKGQPMPRKPPAGPSTSPQTARVGHLYREFADHPSRGLTPAKLARILEEAEQGNLISQARLAEDMEEKDAHLFAELSKRRRALLGLNWDLRPPKDATAQEKVWTASIEGMIRDMDWEGMVYDASAAILYGYACLEYDWERSDGQWQLQAADYRQPDWFTTPAHDRDKLVLRTADGMGEFLQPMGWLVHVHKSKSGYLARGGLARILAWPYLFRNYSARDLAEFLEIYGLPLRLGKYPAGASETEKSTLMKAVMNIGHAAAGIIPQGMELEFQEAAQGASDPFMAMMRWAESSMSKAILGGTLTSQTSESGGGAYALGQVHNEVRHDILVSDARQIARSLTRDLVAPLARLNTPMKRMPSFVFETSLPEDLKLYADALPKLARGMKIPARWAHEKLGIPQPEGDEPVLDFGQASGFAPLRNRAPVAVLRTQQATPLTPDEQTQRLGRDAEPMVQDWVGQIQQLLERVGSMEELADELLTLYPGLDTQDMSSLIGDALMAAELAGRYEETPEGRNG
ncbi:MAG: DUF935 domain-containing protein [Marinobacter sp.]|nr:DUF935 domain-containing protein [Marinobacter sp.]